MTAIRTESDWIGTRELPAEALWGIHTARAIDNFPLTRRHVNAALICAYGAVKLACTQMNRQLHCLDGVPSAELEAACREMRSGQLNGHIVVDALQGGAGTSTNMNVNEVLANRALQLAGAAPGDYTRLHPIEHVNLHQSTNDTYPTAFKVAAIEGVRHLAAALAELVEAFQDKEKAFADIVKVGRTQLQDAVLTTLGKEMASYAEAFGRDRWRIYKCEERLRVVNLGGTAIGTATAAPRAYVFGVVEKLREITGFGLARAENMVESTQNADVFVEVSGMLKACACNLLKTAGDLRLMGSGGFAELRLPARQSGSSIMPSKVNPVIPEAAAQAAMRVMAHDQAIAQACGAGNLELNAFLPLVADSLLDSIDLLTGAATMLRQQCIEGLEADREGCARHLQSATAVVTALVEPLGYKTAECIAKTARETNRSVREVVVAEGLLTGEAFDELLAAAARSAVGSRGSLRA